MKVLLVDDSKMMRTVLKRVLEQTGLPISEVHEACDGEEGFTLACQLMPDLVLSDVNMPHLGGVQLLKKIKDNAPTSAVPVILVTTEGSEPAVAEAMDAGAVGYLLKPFTPEQLVDVLGNAGLINN